MDVELIRAQLRQGGWCRPHVDGMLFHTVRNCSKEVLAKELEKGWELVGIFRGSEYMRVSDVATMPNCVVFRRKAPSFLTAPNPWRAKGPHPWLPNLATGVSEAVAVELTNTSRRGCPVIARRFTCRCGGTLVTADYNKSTKQLEARCASCHRTTVIMAAGYFLDDFDSLPVLIPSLILSWLKSRKKKTTEGDPFQSARYTCWFGFLRKPAPAQNLQRHCCQCGRDRVTLDLGIEYPMASIDGWDFTWLAASATCQSCNKSTIFFDADVTG